MNDLNKLHEEQDAFIKNVFSQDKVVSQPVLKDFTNYIETSNIKVKKYTYKQRKIIALLLILLITSVFFNVYLAFSKNKKTTEISNNNILYNTNNRENDILEENNVENKIIENNSKNEIILETPTNTSTSAIVTPIENNNTNSENINIDELRTLMQNYALGINRISSDTDNLESNTILLFIAKEYFDNKSSKSSLEIDTRYAPTAINMHKYLEELTGNNYSNIEYIPSFNNYIGYAKSSKSYVFGPDSSTITKEKYKCGEIKIGNKINDFYHATAKITRIVDNVETNYDVEFTFKLNSNYTYQKYNLKSLKAKNTSFYPDNTVRLIDQSEVPVEEDEN